MEGFSQLRLQRGSADEKSRFMECDLEKHLAILPIVSRKVESGAPTRISKCLRGVRRILASAQCLQAFYAWRTRALCC